MNPTEAEPRPPLMGEVPVERVRAGELVTDVLWVSFDPAFGLIPATLTISSDWDGAAHGTRRRYTVAHRWTGPICDVHLERDPADLVNIPPGGDRQEYYTVTIGEGYLVCTCRGFVLANDDGRPCKHVAALAFVEAAGLLTEGKPNE